MRARGEVPRDVLAAFSAHVRQVARGLVRAVQARDARAREEGRRPRRSHHGSSARGHHARERVAGEDDAAEAGDRGARAGGAAAVRGVHDRRRTVGRRGDGGADAGATGGADAGGDAD